MAHILYGVGNSILRDFVDATKVVGLAKLKNMQINATANDEKIFGGDDPYPMATFPKDKAITISAENATFSLNMVNVTQGATKKVGAVDMEEVIAIIIPADGIVNLKHDAKVGSVQVATSGFTKVTGATAVAAGNYKEDSVNPDVVNFHTSDAGKEVEIVYTWTSAATAETMEVLKTSMSKPYKFTHRIPIYDDNNQIVAEGQLVIYKAQAKNNFDFNLTQSTASTTKLELEALDPKRPDGKLWDFTIAPVTA